jgi:hypothetical protein
MFVSHAVLELWCRYRVKCSVTATRTGLKPGQPLRRFSKAIQRDGANARAAPQD